MDDSQILQMYLLRDECAILETDKKYGSYCTCLANRILENHQDAEEVVEDTYLQTWNSIPPKQPVSLRLYLAKITRNLSFSKYRAKTAQKRGGGELELALDELSECVGTSDTAREHLEGKELAATIQSLLLTLSKRDRDVFIRRYFFVESVDEIARQYGIQVSNVHMILSRVRKKLKDHLIQEGYVL